MIERERVIEIVVSVAGVGAMIALLYVIGSQHTNELDGHQVLTPEGGELVVYSLAFFLVLMAGAGVILMRTVTVVEAENDDTDGDSSGA